MDRNLWQKLTNLILEPESNRSIIELVDKNGSK